jgi:GNAT superfamily N-acetyltransferase
MQHVMRAMEPRDMEAVRCLLAQLSGYEMTPDEMRDRLDYAAASPIDWLFVCEVEGVVRGVLGFRLREQLERVSRYGEVYLIVADQDVRRQGIGRAMMDFAEQFAREQGCIGTWLVSGFRREAEAHKFYKRLGYEATGYRFVKLFN